LFGVLTVWSVKKIIAVAVLGGLLLAVFLFASRREKDQAIASGPGTTAAAATAPNAPAAQTAAVTVPPPGTTSGPAPTAASPAPPVASDSATCTRLSDLCSTSDQHVDVAQCEKEFADARKMSGASNVARSEQCVADAKTCAAATGCISGGVGMGAMGEFLKGFGSALSH
jgi:hypothetical protein